MTHKKNEAMIKEVVKSAHYAINTTFMIYRKPPANISKENLDLYRSVRSTQILHYDPDQNYIRGRNCFLVEYAPTDLQKAARSSGQWMRHRRRTKHKFAFLFEYAYYGNPSLVNIFTQPHSFNYMLKCFTLDTNHVILGEEKTDCLSATAPFPNLYEFLVHRIYEFTSTASIHVASAFDFNLRLRELLTGDNNG